MRVSIVAAAAENNAIGKNNALLWRLPNDLKHFKALTTGKPVIMGRKTFASIGRPLPNRTNIVVSRQAGLQIDSCLVADSLPNALQTASNAAEACVIGGAEIYAQALPLADTIHLTRVHVAIDGDAHFPLLTPGQWHETFREAHTADERHLYDYTFITLERIP
jgi:dihydrofolate reductase